MDSLTLTPEQLSLILPVCKHISTVTLCKWWDHLINQETEQTAEVYLFGDMYIVRHEYNWKIYLPDTNDEDGVFSVISTLKDRWEVLGLELSEGTRVAV